MTPGEHDNQATSAERETTELYPFSSGYPGQSGTARGPLPDWQAADDALPDLPALEQLPDPDALPDPGYPVMPASPPPVAAQPLPMRPPWPVPEPPAEQKLEAEPEPPAEAQESAMPLTPAEPLPAVQPAEPETPAEPPAAAAPFVLRPYSPPPYVPPPVQPPPASPSFVPRSTEFTGGRVDLPPRQDPEPEPLREPRFSPRPEAYPQTAYRPAEPLPPAQRPLDVQPAWTSEPYRAPRPPEAAPPLHGPSVPWSEVRVGNPYQSDAVAPFAPAPAPAPAPDAQRHTADTLTSDLLLPGKRASPDGGWRRTVYRATGGLIRVGESAASVYRRDLISRVRAPVAGGHYRVAVLSLKGGVGKTTVTVGLGSTLASLRGDRVIAVDGNPDRGTLSDKVHLETAATIRDLLNERAMVTRYADVRAYTSQASSRLEILASDRDPGVSVAFSADDYRTVVGVLEQFYSICITDCGTGLLHSAMAGILELADQVVLVSSPSVDGARSASATLDWLEAHDYGYLVRGGVVVLSSIRRKSKSTVDLDRLEQHFAARCRAVVRVPYDAHLEEGAELELEMLNDETADAYLELAALVADGFAHPRRSVAGATSGFPLA
jgi:MinD-like ATPase involved in chromosome partitioning or flagellar assembly